jgi:hypothetical protein
MFIVTFAASVNVDNELIVPAVNVGCIVKFTVDVTLVNAVIEVMSPFAPNTAADKFVLAVDAVVAFVPPEEIAKTPDIAAVGIVAAAVMAEVPDPFKYPVKVVAPVPP